MLPYAVFMMRLFRAGERPKEVRALDAVDHGVSFRMSEKTAQGQAWDKVECSFLDYSQQTYRKVTLSTGDFEIIQVEDAETERMGARLYELHSEKEEFLIELDRLLSDYMHYIRVKTENDELSAMEEMTGVKLSDKFHESLKDWQQSMLQSARPVSQPGSALRSQCVELCPAKIAVCLDSPHLWKAYLKKTLPEFLEQYWEENGLADSFIARQKITHMYIGNGFCPQLFPGEIQLKEILTKTEKDGLTPVVVFSAMPEHMADDYRNMVKTLLTCRQLPELVANDLGFLLMLEELRKEYLQQEEGQHEEGFQQREWFPLQLGPLLCKRKKDPRMEWKACPDKEKEANFETAVNGLGYLRYLQERYGAQGISMETCGYPIKVSDIGEGMAAAGNGAGLSLTLHLPMYQTNTSGYCTMAALCLTGDRKKQQEIGNCPCYCEEHVVLYPKNSGVIGRWNSLFGCDTEALEVLYDGIKLNDMIRQGVKRLVIRM